MTRLIAAFALVAIPCVAFLAPVPKAQAAEVIVFHGDTYAAIAYSPATGKVGYAYNCGSRFSAETAALRKCPYADARIVGWVHNGFLALAVSADCSSWGVGYSYGDGATNTYAKQRALYECRKRGDGARLALCLCSTNVYPEVF